MAVPLTTPLYNGLDTDSVFDVTYPNQTLHDHATKIWAMSYPEFEQNRVREKAFLPSAMFRKYVKCIDELYGVAHNDYQFLNDAYQRVRDFSFFAAVKRVRGRTNCQTLSFKFVDPTLNRESPVIVLNLATEVQNQRVAMVNYTYDELREAKRQNHPMVIEINGGYWTPGVMNEDIENFEFSATHLHPEGFQDWVYFGRGISCQIEIFYRARLWPTDIRKDIFDFHLQTIHRMIRKRLEQSVGVVWHQYMAKTNNITCRRFLVTNPSSLDRYWRKPRKGLDLEEIREWAESLMVEREMPKGSVTQLYDYFEEEGSEIEIENKKEAWSSLSRSGELVNYLEFHRSLNYSDDVEETVCLCNEWCNWSAFFHYNPIYRFIVQMNSILYMPNFLTSPELYALASQVVLTQQNPHPRCCYVLPLLYSAYKYQALLETKYMVPFPIIRQMWANNVPSPYLINAVNYKKLSHFNAILFGRICRHFDTNPLADICVKNLINFFTLLERLHYWVAQHGNQNFRFILQARRKDWNKEFEHHYRKPVGVYLTLSYGRLFQAQRPLPDPTGGAAVLTEREAIDRIFGTDVEFIEFVPQSEGAAYMKYRRLRSIGSVGNRFNVRLNLDPFLNTYIGVYKFITRIESQLAKPRRLQTLNDIRVYLARFDAAFEQQFNARQQSVGIVLNADDVRKRNLWNRYQRFAIVFFTLKLYSFAFVIQKHCFEIRAQELYRDPRYYPDQFTGIFNFTTRTDVIEKALKNHPMMAAFYLFQIDNLYIDRFRDFFDNFWGQPTHESQDQQNHIVCVRSARTQYLKLFVFSQHNGIKKARFTTIFMAFRQSSEAILQRSEEIFNQYIIAPMEWLEGSRKYADTIDVVDVLALYLVRATCFTFSEMICKLFRELKNIQVLTQIQKNTSFSLGKPGWIQLLRTRHILTPLLDSLRTKYTVYDDEIERIGKTLEDFPRLMKYMAREYYKKLSNEWMAELGAMVNRTIQGVLPQNPAPPLTPLQEQYFSDMMLLQLAAGVTFTCAFHDQFRTTFYYLRRTMFVRLMHDITRTMAHGPHLARVAHCRPVMADFMQDRQAVRQAQAFQNPHWYDRLTTRLQGLATLTPQDVGLDMGQCNQFIH